ncbi:MAG: VCBS repeat-containing protein, partial [Caldilineaceae bacterium]|nr:VCBS repeat-containing protein [Caldilineaceae bacterium]
MTETYHRLAHAIAIGILALLVVWVIAQPARPSHAAMVRATPLPLDRWQRHLIDENRPWRALFITAADIDGDQLLDLVTGGWWYKQPPTLAGTWSRSTIGAPLNNMAAVFDFDGDGDADLLGTDHIDDWTNFVANDVPFTWAQNDGQGQFTLLHNVADGYGNFLQGIAVQRFQENGPQQVALSWQNAAEEVGIQMLTVPTDTATAPWPWQRISPTAQGEALSAGDIDRDGDADLLLGTRWLENTGSVWLDHTLYATTKEVDRNRLADINNDGRLDAVVGYQAANKVGKLAWYEQGATATAGWKEHVVAQLIGPMSLDVADMDGDGDLDLIVGEHNTANPQTARLFIFENEDGNGATWAEHTVYTGDEHHDGAQVVDLDGDGDLDIISIGWSHSKVLFYENQAIDQTTRPTATHTA